MGDFLQVQGLDFLTALILCSSWSWVWLNRDLNVTLAGMHDKEIFLPEELYLYFYDGWVLIRRGTRESQVPQAFQKARGSEIERQENLLCQHPLETQEKQKTTPV